MIVLFILINVVWAIYKIEDLICVPNNNFTHVFAPPGTGKTTLVAKIVREELEQGRKVYSNVPVNGAFRLNLKNIGKYEYKNCTLLIDEAGSSANLSNRNWQTNLTDNQIDYLKLHRHYNVNVYTFSQSYGEVDNKYRELTTELYLLKKSKLPFFIKALCIEKKTDLINGKIVEFFEENKKRSYRFFKPKCWAWFNSFEQDMALKPLPIFESRYLKIDVK